MRSYKYDFHVHSCLSPCGDEAMTPNNIANMALIAGCEILAITDHNSAKNAGAVMAVGKQNGLLVIPGMELCTSEEAHIVCLFEDLEKAEKFSDYVYQNMPEIKNKSEIFGRQLVMNSEDEIIEEEDVLLINASFISAEEVMDLMDEFGGVAFPAHVDKDSYSILASLGAIPKECRFTAMELSKRTESMDFYDEYPDTNYLSVLRNSDAHYLENIPESFDEIQLEELNIKAVIDYIRNLKRD